MYQKTFASLVILMGILLLSACKQEQKETSSKTNQTAITPEELGEHVKILASDKFEGREPGTLGGEKTVNYIAQKFEKIGLKPGNGNSWFQEVPLVSIDLQPKSSMSFASAKNTPELKYKENMVMWTKRAVDSLKLEDSELVFVGYGIVAPEYNWNDYEGLDVEGKTVVMLVNDPGYATHDPELFTSKKMTYYGRWTYKFEEAARQGAAGAIVIHETGPAGYPWGVVSGGWSGPQYDMQAENKHMNRVKLEGWITHQLANKLLQRVGLTYEEAKEMALQKDFEPIPLEVKVNAELYNKIERTQSRNVVGVLPGKKRPKETIIYTAHWDHLGTDPNLEGEDKIYNGAIDNATGVAALIEIAEKFAAQGATERSVVFLAVTAEESGLLGSKYYAEHPLFPLSRTAGVINMDALSPHGKTKDLRVVGYDKNSLITYLRKPAKKHDRKLLPGAHPEAGIYFRSDHFSFAKKGVPALYIESGSNYLEGGEELGHKYSEDYVSNRYHKPADEYDPSWEFTGMTADLNLLYQAGRALADTTDWPTWSEGVAFKKTRQESAAKRQ